MKDWIKQLFGDEPVITRIGPVIALLATYLVARGLLDSDTGQLIVGIIGAIGGSGLLVSARSAVYAESKADGPEHGERPE